MTAVGHGDQAAARRWRERSEPLPPGLHGAPEDHPIRLMLAIGSLGIGGSEKQLTALIAGLPRDRFDPVLLTSVSQRTRYREQVLAAGVPIISMPSSSGTPTIRRIMIARRYCAALRLIRPDLVYAWLDETAAVVAPICLLMGIPCAVARRNILGSALEQRHPQIGGGLRRAETLATLVTANSAAVAAACVARGHDPDRVRIVPNGHEHLPRLPTPPAPPVVFGYVAQFREGKGHHRLIDVIERMPRGSWRVDLAGEGPLRQQIAHRIARAGLQKQVRLIGAVADMRGFWRERHVALLLSDSEGLPNVLLEAAFAGRPAIATRVGGTPEVVGTGGILVPLDSPAAAAAAMIALVEDPDRRERLGREIWHHVADTYSLPRMVKAHVEALEETRWIARR